MDSIIDEINFKLEQLGQYIEILREYQSYEIEEIRKNRTLRGAVERYIEISLACIIDLEKLHSHLENDLDDLELFAEYIARYLIAKHGNKFT